MAGCMAGRIVTSKEVAPGVGGPGPGRRAASRYGCLAVSCELAGLVDSPNNVYDSSWD